jgi:Fic family protein
MTLDLWDQPRHMTPLLPQLNEAWSVRCADLLRAAAQLDGALPTGLRAPLAGLLELMNCYYSNLIEGHRTAPGEVVSAMRRAPKQQQELVHEAIAHIEVQRLVRDRISDPAWSPVTTDTLCWLHARFIQSLPEPLRVQTSPDGRIRQAVEPGALRTGPVTVGEREPPRASSLPRFLDAFTAEYRDHARPTPEALARIAAAHHRLAWIHPFFDGNGRVARLMTDAMLERAQVGAGGIWRLSRGLARRQTDYRLRLADADLPRRGDLDGRGNLTQAGLDRWCAFVLDTALDQVGFMRDLLDLPRLSQRIRQWCARAYPRHDHERIGLLLALIVSHGGVDRATATTVLAVSERQARRIIDDLAGDGLVATGTRAPLTPSFPLHVVPHWFPDLFPAGENASLESVKAAVPSA